jgi:hypothetical protein
MKILAKSIAATFVACISSFTFGQTTYSTSESCNCTVDTSGLASYLGTLTLSEDTPLSFEVESSSSTFAVLHGYIDGSTPTVVNTFISSYPEVTTLVFMQMPGSDDDESNLIASMALKEAGFKYYLPSVNQYPDDAFIASGAVDMFLSGNVRVIEEDAEVGVHSWSDGVNDATDYPEGHPYHQPYIDYYVSVGFSTEDAEAFYYFTINAAPAAGIHNMTEAEIEQYKLRTCIYSDAPSYSVYFNDGSLSATLAGASYQWVDCDDAMAPIDGETSQTFTPPSNGSYAVEVSEEGCEGVSDCVTITDLGTVQPTSINLKLFPNPVAQTLIIQGSEIETDLLKIFDGSGKETSSLVNVSQTNQNEIQMDISKLPKGIYTLSLGQFKKQFIVE